MFTIQITLPAQVDIENAFTWWAENRSAVEAAEWYDMIFMSIDTLKSMPERFPLVAESGLSKLGVRQLLFGIGTHPTHRIIFIVSDEIVSILRVRHHAQRDLD